MRIQQPLALLLLMTLGYVDGRTLLAAPACTPYSRIAGFCEDADLTGAAEGDTMSLDARATTVTFDWLAQVNSTLLPNATAASTAVRSICSLDGLPVPDCTLPYSTSRLLPGVHTFSATYLDPVTLQAVGAAVQTTWEVRPRLHIVTPTAHMTVAKNTRGEARFAVDSTSAATPLAPGQLQCALLDHTDGAAPLGFAVQCDAGTEVVVSLDSFELGAAATSAAATVMVVDAAAAAAGVTSELTVSATAELFVSMLRLFPSADVQAAELGLDGVVTAGGAAEGTRVQLLSVADAAVQGTLNWTVSRTYAWARADDGSGVVTEASQVPVLASSSLVLLGSKQTAWASGGLTYSGAIHDLTLSFPPAPAAFVGLWVQQFAVTSSLDPAPILLRVAMEIIPGPISNRSAVAFADSHADAMVSSADGLVTVVAEAGSDVSLTVRPRDRFENSIGSDDFIFELDMSLSSAGASQDAPPAESPDAWTFTAPAYDLLVSTGWAAVYEGSVNGVAPAGDYVVRVSTLTDGATTLLLLDELLVRAEPKMCDASQKRVTSTSGTACACVAGYEASGFATDGGVRCVACGVGQYSTAAVPAVSCVLCPVGTTTVGTNATSAAQCVCQPGAYADANGACALCPQGSYSAAPGATVCDPCPPGTITDLLGSVELSACRACDRNRVAPASGMTVCQICADAHAGTVADDRVTCRCEDDWYDGAMGMLAANGTAEKVCKACPRGARCKGDAIIANAGFWRQGRDEERLYRCRSGYCNAEEALVAGDDAEPEADAVCRPGHTGVLCFSCVEGYAQQGAYCERCNPSRGHSPALLVPMITVSAICLALLWLLLPLFVDFSKIGEWVQSTADWGEIHLLMLLGFKPNKLQRLDTLLTRTKSGRSRSFITSRSFANLTTGGDDDDDNTDLASAHNSGRFRRNSARWSTYSAAESMAASRMSTGSWDSARASEMGEMRAIQKVLQRQTARGEAWVRVRGSLKIVIGFYQVLASFDDVYTIPWPQRLLDFFAMVQVIELNIFTMPALSCVYPNPDFYVTFHAMLLLPLVVGVVTAALFKALLRWSSGMRTDRELRRRVSYHFVHSMLFFLFLMYPSLSAKVLNVFNCVEVHGEYYLAVDMRRKCASGVHFWEMMLGAVGVLLYPIGIPALFLLMMRQHSVHQLAYYKKARFVVLRLVKYVALSNAHVHAHVTTHSERTMFEDIPLPLLRRVAFTLLPPPLPSDQQGSRPMSPAPTVVIGVPSAMSTLSTSTGMLSDDEKLEKRTLAADVEQPEKAECSLESHPYESARQLQESEEETEATSGEAAPADRDVGGIEEEEEEEEDDDDDDGGNGVVSPYRSTKWRRPSRLSLLSPTRSPPRSLDSEPEPEPDHWPKGLSREELVAVMMVYATQDPRGVALCPAPIMGWLEGVDGRPLHRGHSTHFEKRQMLAFARLSLIFNMYQVNTWWYELLDLARKLLLNGALLFIAQDSAAQVALGSLICAAMVCVSVGLRPFMDVSHNNLSLVCLVHLSFTLYVGLLLKVNTVQPGPLLTVLTSLIIAISIWIIVVPITQLVLALSGLTPAVRKAQSRFLEKYPAASNLQRMIEVPRAKIEKAPSISQRDVQGVDVDGGDAVPDVVTPGDVVLEPSIFSRLTSTLTRNVSSGATQMARSLSRSASLPTSPPPPPAGTADLSPPTRMQRWLSRGASFTLRGGGETPVAEPPVEETLPAEETLPVEETPVEKPNIQCSQGQISL